MCDQVNLPLSPSNPPQFQLHPTTPEKIPNPNLQKRMEEDTCFKCHQKGHWSWFCPFNSPNQNPFSSSHSPTQHSPLSPQNIHCRCGYGFCIIKTSRSDRNPGRKYYACPVQRGAQCKKYGFMKWCDEPVDESDLLPPLFKYPVCECGAGVCRRVKGTEQSTNVVKHYFECPVKKDHGSCGYQVSEDEVLNNTSITPTRQSMSDDEVLNNTSITPIQKNRQRSLDEFYQNDKTENDLGDGLREGEGEDDGGEMEADPSKVVGFPKFKIADDDSEFADLAIQAEADLSPSLSTPSRISARQSDFYRDIVDASFDACLLGWLGRLVFIHPTQGLKFPAPQPFFCCVFPSFNPISVPTQTSIIPRGPGECNDNSLNQHTQPSTTCQTQVSRDLASSTPPGSGNKPLSMSKRQKEVALFMQQQLLSDLENLDPREHESMTEAAETTFTLLNRLEDDCEQFSQYVWDFINLTSSLVEMEENSPTLEEHQKLYEKEKIILDCIKDDLAETEALLKVSNQHRKSLCEEISHLEAMLHEKKNQLESCEVETLQMETHLDNLKRSMLETDITLRDRAEHVEIARKQSEERQAKQVAAKTALENAKHELEN